jgi:putative transposase
MKKRTFSAAFKAEVVQEIIRGEKTIAQIAAARKIHPNVVSQWKAIALKGLPSLFIEKNAFADREAELQETIEGLYSQIGVLTTQVTWLKKKSGLNPDAR